MKPSETARIDIGDPLAEHQAVRNEAGIIDRSGRGKIRLTGADRAELLHGITTQEIKKLQPGQGAAATSINDVGRIITEMKVYCLPDSLVLDVDPDLAEKTVAWIDRYIVTEDVTVQPIDDAAILGVHGPQAPDILARVFGEVPLPQEELHHVTAGDCRIAANRYTGEKGFDIWCPPERASHLWDDLVAAGARPFGPDALNTLRIEAGIPWYGVDMDEENNPLEAGLHLTVNFDKGCYMGQEVMARLTFRAGPVRSLMGFKTLDGSRLAAGDRLFMGDKEFGRITSSVHSPTLGIPITLGYVRREHKEPGTRLRASHDERDVDVEVVALPWVRK